MYRDKKAIFVKIIFIVMMSVLCFVWLRGLLSAYKQPVYKAWFAIGETEDDFIEVNNVDQKIVQEFEVPYDDSFEKAAVKIGTYSDRSRSQWKAELYESGQDEPLYERTFDSKNLKDNEYFNIIDKKVEVKKEAVYKLIITPLKIQGELGLAFYADKKGTRGELLGGDSEEKCDLDLKIYCCSDIDCFWAGVYIAISFLVILIFVRIWFLRKRTVSWVQDILLQAMALVLISFFLRLGGVDAAIFMDENDNIRGGMVIANGGVLYKDYVTQHTPFMYYLCAVFTKLGAGSVSQFRILYYIFCSLFSGMIYLRNGETFGKGKMALFLIWCPLVSFLIFSDYSLRILSDNVQSMALIMLLLEYLRYRKKPGVGIRRSVIVSMAVFVSFGCAFLSVYPIVVICVSVIINEGLHIRKKRHGRRKRPVIYYIKRYRKLVLVCLLPFALSLVYFAVQGGMPSAYEMAYRFNIEVYEKYSQLGSSKLGPVFMGIKKYFQNNIQIVSDISGQFSLCSFVSLLLLMTFSFCIGMELRKKNYLNGITIFLFLCMCCTREEISNNFHYAAFWSSILLIVILYAGRIKVRRVNVRVQQVTLAVVVSAVSFMLYTPYNPILRESFFSDHAAEVNDWEKYIVDNTKEEDCILVDFVAFESIYLQYKGRYSVSRVPYFLPWYMDWYQDEIIKDIQDYKPKYILYNPNMEVWGIKGFLEPLKKQVDKEYMINKRTGIYCRK